MNYYKIVFIGITISSIQLTDSINYYGELYLHTHEGMLSYAIVKAKNMREAKNKAKSLVENIKIMCAFNN